MGGGTVLTAGDLTVTVNGVASTVAALATLQYGDTVTLSWTRAAHNTYTLTNGNTPVLTTFTDGIIAGNTVR